VTLFGVINDIERRVQVVLDEALVESEVINVHPLHNEATTSIRNVDLIRFLRSTGHEPAILKITQ
jgi:Ala-tRNA(Pro) deacylase